MIVEIIARFEEKKLLKDEFEIIRQDIEKINDRGYTDVRIEHLKYMALHPSVKMISYFDGEEHEIVYSKVGISQKIPGITVRVPDIGATIKKVTLHGYIPILNHKGDLVENLYLKLSRERKYGLLSSIYWFLLFSSGILLLLIFLGIENYYKENIFVPIEKMNEFSRAILDDFGVFPMNIISPETQILTSNLNLILQKVNDLKHSPKNGKQKNEESHVLLDIFKIIMESKENSPQIYDKITKYINQTFSNVACCSLWFLESFDDVEKQVIRKGVFYNEHRFPIDKLTVVSRNITQKVIEQGKAEIVSDFEASLQYSKWRDAYPLAVMIVPIKIKNITMGCLCVWKVRVPYTKVFHDETINLIHSIAELLGVVMEYY